MKYDNRRIFNTIKNSVMIALMLAIIIGCSLGIISYYNSSIALKNNIINSLIKRTEENADIVFRILEVFKTNIEGIAFRSEIQTMDLNIQKPVLMNEVKRLGVLRMQVADLNVYTKSTNGKEFDISDREHFRKALQGETVVSDPLISKFDGSIIFVCATPIRDNHGKIVGVLTTALEPHFLFNIIRDTKVEKTGYSFMVNSKGVIVAHPRKELVLTDADAIWKKEKPAYFEGLQQAEKEVISGKTGFQYYKYYNVDKCIAYAPVPGTDWSLVLTVPQSEIFNDLHSLRRQFIASIGILLLISILLGFSIFIYIIERRKTLVLRQGIEERNRLLRESEEMERLRTQFFANISHELRTPLNVIVATIQLFELYSKSNSELINIRKYIKILKQNSQRLLRIINNLIDITRIDSGLLELTLKNENIVNVVEEIVLSIVEYARTKEIELTFDTTVEELITAIDIEKFERIILNLLSNSIKYTEKGGHIYVHVSDEKENTVIISVKDTGIGIPKDKQETIFERFIQVDQSLTRSHEGSGIGLSLVKSMVEMHGGRVFVQSEEGKGSEFIIELPIVVMDDEKSKDDDILANYSVRAGRIEEEFSDVYFDSKI